MANLFPTIVPGKILINRTHKIRIALSHNGETRYIVTDIIVDSEKEFRNGVVVKRPDALYLNTKLRKLIDKYQKTLDIIDCQECMTCSQLLAVSERIRSYAVLPGSTFKNSQLWL